MPRVVISGWYGHGNVGDEAILAAMIQRFQAEFSPCDIQVLSFNPRHTNAMHGVSAVWQVPTGLLSWGKRLLDGRLWHTLESIAACDVFVMGGGGFLSDWQPEVPWSWLKQLLIAKLFRKKTMMYGIGAGPFTRWHGRLITRLMLNAFADRITVRDQKSFDHLLSIGVNQDKIQLTGDPAVCLDSVTVTNPELSFKVDAPNIAVIVAPIYRNKKYWEGKTHKYDIFKDQLFVTLRALSEMDANIIFIPFQPATDKAFSIELAESLGEETQVFHGEPSPTEMLAILSRFDLVLTLRLHGSILSSVAGTVPVSIAYHHKGIEYLERLGLTPYSCAIGDGINLPDQDLDGHRLTEICEDVLNRKSQLSADIKRRLNEYRNEENFNILTLRNLVEV